MKATPWKSCASAWVTLGSDRNLGGGRAGGREQRVRSGRVRPRGLRAPLEGGSGHSRVCTEEQGPGQRTHSVPMTNPTTIVWKTRMT